MDRAWPIISNRRLLAVNQRWAGSPGRRVTLSADGWQAWAKPMGGKSYAVFLMNGGEQTVAASLPLRNVSAAFAGTAGVCARDLYTGKAVPALKAGAPLAATLGVHDSAFYCAWPSADGGCGGASDCP